MLQWLLLCGCAGCKISMDFLQWCACSHPDYIFVSVFYDTLACASDKDMHPSSSYTCMHCQVGERIKVDGFGEPQPDDVLKSKTQQKVCVCVLQFPQKIIACNTLCCFYIIWWEDNIFGHARKTSCAYAGNNKDTWGVRVKDKAVHIDVFNLLAGLAHCCSRPQDWRWRACRVQGSTVDHVCRPPREQDSQGQAYQLKDQKPWWHIFYFDHFWTREYHKVLNVFVSLLQIKKKFQRQQEPIMMF